MVSGKPTKSRAYWLLAGCGFLLLSLLVFAVSGQPAAPLVSAVASGAAAAPLVPAAAPPSGPAAAPSGPAVPPSLVAADPKADRRPGRATGLEHPYLFLWIWEDNSLHAFRGFAVRQGVREAATYNEKTRAITVHKPVTPSPDTRILILIEASTGDTLLFSELHPVSDLPWSYAIPDLEWWGVYRAGAQAGETTNMVVNENRFLRGPVEVLRVNENGAVTIRFADETFSLQPGEGHQIVKMVHPDRQLYSRLVVYHQGEWNMERVTLAFPPGAGESP